MSPYPQPPLRFGAELLEQGGKPGKQRAEEFLRSFMSKIHSFLRFGAYESSFLGLSDSKQPFPCGGRRLECMGAPCPPHGLPAQGLRALIGHTCQSQMFQEESLLSAAFHVVKIDTFGLRFFPSCSQY